MVNDENFESVDAILRRMKKGKTQFPSLLSMGEENSEPFAFLRLPELEKDKLYYDKKTIPLIPEERQRDIDMWLKTAEEARIERQREREEWSKTAEEARAERQRRREEWLRSAEEAVAERQIGRDMWLKAAEEARAEASESIKILSDFKGTSRINPLLVFRDPFSFPPMPRLDLGLTEGLIDNFTPENPLKNPELFPLRESYSDLIEQLKNVPLNPFRFQTTQDARVVRLATEVVSSPAYISSEARAIAKAVPHVYSSAELLAQTRYDSFAARQIAESMSSFSIALGTLELKEKKVPLRGIPDELKAQIDQVNYCFNQVYEIIRTGSVRDTYARNVGQELESSFSRDTTSNLIRRLKGK